ncbi:FecR family protein [Gaoshiqia sediminis]|uniref:FecR domain-containing protein n=1 Tax=Gaoshiqia sediminis TaxID=2986998 RepID=A0AA41YCI7_9BACT|nr:FecR domain-containing protein [Gaoshiqia sediminis]MCW0483968.1 FecR domain-containing protein [Gaoshiqia sediminis]
MEELLLKYINGDCTDAEKVTVITWLDADPKNMKEYLALRKLNDIMIWQADAAIAPQKKSNEKAAIRRGNRYVIEALKIAAIFVVAFFVSHYFLPENMMSEGETAMQTLHVPAGQRAEITLGDGTKVWLNAKTTLTFPNQFSGDTREVQLDGEGFFEVTTDKSKPFIVTAGEYNVKVWGTKFNLMAYAGTEVFETSLLEGAVEVLKQGNSSGIMLKPDEQASLREDKIVVAPIRNMDHFVWREGILSFDNATFTELVNQLELYFDLTIEVKSRRALNYHCTGKFRTKDGVEHILKVLQLENKFSYTIDDKRNKITIE